MACRPLRSLLFSAASAVLALAAVPNRALASAPVAAPVSDQSATSADIVVTAQRLDAARAAIEPSLGASTYTLTTQAVEALPGGENIDLSQVLLQAPGVAQDSFGQLHVRGDHADLQYRINNVILPEGLSVFGQVLSPRLAEGTELITGALPAQYGLRSAGVVNITTKSGLRTGGEASIYGGSHGRIEPSFEYGGSGGGTNYFISGSYLQDDLGIESPDGGGSPLHDRTRQFQGFAYVDHIIDPASRISLILGTSDEDFQIPNRRGLNADDPGGLGLTVFGQTSFPSERLDERQREDTQFGIVSYLHTADRATLQVSLFSRYSILTFQPDPLGDLLFNGISQSARKADVAGGLQVEGAYDLNDRHTLRAGLIAQEDRATSDTTSLALPVNAGGLQTSDQPLTVVDNTGKGQLQLSLYLQDEWKLPDDLTMNYGLRFDQVNAYLSENQVSPRINLVWAPFSGTTIHAGYARYFSPPPFELVAGQTLAKFAGTTAAPSITRDDLPHAERDNYYDIGAQQKLGSLTLGVDGYWRDAKNLVDEGQFGAPIIETPFNYAVGRIRGVEFSATYDRGPLSAWANLAAETAKGKDIVSSQFNFTPGELVYIAGHYIYLDHSQTLTASGGASYRLGPAKLSADVLYGSGLRATPDGAPPNSGHLPGYAQVNLAASWRLDLPGAGPLDLRFDVINVLDAAYEIRDGSGVGVGAPQWGPRRGYFVGLTKSF